MLFLAIAGSLSCVSQAAPDPGPSACSDADAYAFEYIDRFESVGQSDLWSANDSTAGSSASAMIETIAEGPRCASGEALVLRSSGNATWGSLFGFSEFDNSGPKDASAYQGLSFWARALGKTKNFTVIFDDPNTTPVPGGYCGQYVSNCGAADASTTVDPATGCPSTGITSPPSAGECGNSYSTQVTVTGEWRLYTIPFGRFQQADLPNRVPNALLTQTGSAPGTALLTASLSHLIFGFPKSALVELWLDDVGFYRSN